MDSINTSNPIDSLIFHGNDGERVVVRCGRTGCIAELSLPGTAPGDLEAEILIQHRDTQGRAVGPITTLCRHVVTVLPLTHCGQLVGRFWLPERIRWPALVNCFVRLGKIRSSLNQ
ncbi:MAG: hypothetical protein KDA92_21570 [Planctomycetales bacterium]|nr:hypothetical protein [Planctomycetales bacterium]MCA9168897.1 hypothetical protein [Planctomycetales bacterium]